MSCDSQARHVGYVHAVGDDQLVYLPEEETADLLEGWTAGAEEGREGREEVEKGGVGGSVRWG